MREKVFVSEFVRSIKSSGGWAHKISDSPIRFDEKKVYYMPDKPFDIFGCWNGRAFAVECKQIKRFSSFGIEEIRPSQIEGLNILESVGAKTFIALNIRIPPASGEKRINRLVLFSWPDFKSSPRMGKKEVSELPGINGRKGEYNLTEWLAREVA